MYNYALRAHYPEDKKKNFSLPKAKQNPFFGLEPVLEELLRIANSIRFPSRALSVDEELTYLLGRARVIQFIKEKHNRYGPKLFICSGENEGTNHKGYCHWAKFYYGKGRCRPTSFSGHGKGYEVVMAAILYLQLRYKGYWVFTDSWFTSLTGMLHGRIWGVNMAGTISGNRTGLDTKDDPVFKNLLKAMKKNYDAEKCPKGYIRGDWEARGAQNHDIVVSSMKDSRVVLLATNAVGTHEWEFFRRWSKDQRKYVKLVSWRAGALFGKNYGMGDQGTMWRTASGGHKFKSNKWWQACRDFFLWGLVIVWEFLNMKLSKPYDNRPMWKFKHSLINEYKNEAQKLGFRRRNSTRVETKIPEKKPKLKATRQKRNPYKCELGKKQSRDRRLRAAEYCERTSGRRMIGLADFLERIGKIFAVQDVEKAPDGVVQAVELLFVWYHDRVERTIVQ